VRVLDAAYKDHKVRPLGSSQEKQSDDIRHRCIACDQFGFPAERSGSPGGRFVRRRHDPRVSSL
jgi:hypothetical protein